jgi:SAM-dependent methyltransferase
MTDTTQDIQALKAHWQAIHHDPRHLLVHPSEVVIRWRHASLPKPATTDDRALDIGCAGGRHARFLANEGFHVDAIDIADSAIANLAQDENNRIHAQVAAADALDFADGSFAGVLCYGVYTYMDDDAIRSSIGQVRRLLRPGGSFLLVVRADTDWRADHGTVVSPGRVRADRLAGTPADAENGLTMTLPDRPRLESWLSDFNDIKINFETWSTGNGRYANFDWHAVARA